MSWIDEPKICKVCQGTIPGHDIYMMCQCHVPKVGPHPRVAHEIQEYLDKLKAEETPKPN